MKVKLRTHRVSAEEANIPGDEIEVETAEAVELMISGQADPVGKASKDALAKAQKDAGAEPTPDPEPAADETGVETTDAAGDDVETA